MPLEDSKFSLILCLMLASILIFTTADLIADMQENTSTMHLLVEGAIVFITFTALAWLIFRYLSVKSVALNLQMELTQAHADALKWRSEASGLMQGLSFAIDRQFSEWRLSPAEKEIGLLLLKGLSLKEIASVRETSERTVRQQAQDMYRKAKVAGRIEFAAFFLEDLMVPQSAASQASQ